MSEENEAIVPQPEAPKANEAARKATQLKRGPRGTQFNTVEEALGYATACFRSGMLPSHIKTPEQAFVIMDNGAELGLRPWASWKLIYITKQGRIATMSRGALAIVQACPHYEYYDERIELEGTEQMKGVAVAKRKGSREIVKTFSLDDAKKAGLTVRKKNHRGDEYDGPWQSFLKDMLLARARDRALNTAFAAELAGIELETFADDADRLEIKAEGGGVESIGPPRDLPESVEEPKALPAPQADPLLVRVLQDSGQQPQPVEAPKQAAPPPEAAPEQREQISQGVDEALGEKEPPEPETPGEKPKRKRRTRKKATAKHKVGDLIRNGTRRVLEVDEDGRPTVVEKIAPLGEDPNEEGDPKNCPREDCGTALNLLGQCDACGWPTADLRG